MKSFLEKRCHILTNKKNERLPYIIETSAGLNRMLLTVLTNAYWDDKENNRIVLKLSPKIAPVKAAICPLTKKDGLPEKAKENYGYFKAGSKLYLINRVLLVKDIAGKMKMNSFGITIDHQTVKMFYCNDSI